MKDMNYDNYIAPLTKTLRDACVDAGVKYFILRFEGGDDQGFLNVELCYKDEFGNLVYEVGGGDSSTLTQSIEDWAYDAYNYSGAGDGSPYGDNYTYNLVDNTVKHDSWRSVVEHDAGDKVNLEIADDNKE